LHVRSRLMSWPPSESAWTRYGLHRLHTLKNSYMGWYVDHSVNSWLSVPDWLLLLLLLALPLLGARRLNRYRRDRDRRRRGLCEKCGYDLRASSGRCPECGQTFASVA
jgi:hypothetical protein